MPKGTAAIKITSTNSNAYKVDSICIFDSAKSPFPTDSDPEYKNNSVLVTKASSSIVLDNNVYKYNIIAVEGYTSDSVAIILRDYLADEFRTETFGQFTIEFMPETFVLS